MLIKTHALTPAEVFTTSVDKILDLVGHRGVLGQSEFDVHGISQAYLKQRLSAGSHTPSAQQEPNCARSKLVPLYF